MTENSTEKEKVHIEEELAGALAAMQRARRRAEKVARDTGTMLVQAVDGKPVRVPPPPAE